MDSTPPATEAALDGNSLSWFQAIAITLLLGISTVLALYGSRGDKSKPDKAEANAEEEEEEERVTQEIPPEHMPTDGVFTIKSLKKFNGINLPICMGVCGKVCNVSSSANIQAGEGYGKLWAGNDATYALATLSLDPKEANKLDYKLEDFSADQQKALAGWYKHFTTKYPVIGTMKEYKGWDFSKIHALAENETPFASSQKKDKGEPKAEDSAKTKSVAKSAEAKSQRESTSSSKPTEVPEEVTSEANSSARGARSKEVEVSTGEKIKVPEDAQVLRKGSSVSITGLEDSQNGREGILNGFQAEKQQFEVLMYDTGKLELFGPANLKIC